MTQVSMSERNISEIAGRYMWALGKVSIAGMVDATAVQVCMLLALRELDIDNVAKLETSPGAFELDDLERYIAANYPDSFASDDDIATIAIKLLQNQSAMILSRTTLIAELDARIANLKGSLDMAYATHRGGVIAVNGDGGHNTEVLGPALDLSPKETADIQFAIADQLAASFARLDGLDRIAVDADSPSATEVVDENKPIRVANPCDPDDLGIDWQGLPPEYRETIDGLTQWRLEWSKQPMSARRSIALYAIAWIAGEEGTLTMAQFESRKPGWMPSAGAIAQMFNHRWSEVMKNAVAHIKVES